jgi:hypothetical protein
VQELYAEATADPCLLEDQGTFTQSYHIGAIFAVLVASAIGAVFPLVLGIYREHPTLKFIIVLGKCMGTGVVLAVGLIHMLMVSFSFFRRAKGCLVYPKWPMDWPMDCLF